MSSELLTLMMLAQAAQLPTYGPDWQMIAMGLLSIVLALVANYAKNIAARVTKLEADQSSLHALVKGDYPTRHEINQSFERVEASLRGITGRLDRIIDHDKG